MVPPALALLVLAAAPQQAPGLRAPADRPLRFAVIGDYGQAGLMEQLVADKVKSWSPEFVVTCGDNNYPSGTAATIDSNIGRYYHGFIKPYTGVYGAGAPDRNRFFPVPGNHDWYTPGLVPYLNYFTLPGNERYYDVRWGPVHLFCLDSDVNEPDGNTAASVQAAWLQGALAASTAPFRLVFLHHSPYSSSSHGNQLYAQWPFQDWGATAVFGGHDHSYERILLGGFPYFVNGLGGSSIYSFYAPVAGSEMRYNNDYGAILVEASYQRAVVQFISRGGNVVDTITLLPGGGPPTEDLLLPRGSTWKYLDDGSDQGTAWRDPAFDDSAWASGDAQLGYGDGDETTVVSYGSNPNAKYITTWFRSTFAVANPGQYQDLRLRLLRDDGAVVYLNGVEVHRSNMPAGTIDYLTQASTAIFGGAEDAFEEVVLAPSLLVAGNNTLAVEIHQVNGTSSDIPFDLELAGTLPATTLVPAGAVWRYRDTGVAPPPYWKGVHYNDATWSAGPAQLGYGEGDEATVVSFGPDPNNKHITTWFRHSFTVANPGAFQRLELSVVRDDGCIVYLNGQEVFRSNMPEGPPTATTRAPMTIFGADENVFITTWVDPALLRAGNNVLAVEVHQERPDSSDLSFDLSLTGR